MLHRIIEILIWVIVGTGIILLLSFTKKQQGTKICNNIEIHIDQSTEDTLITNDQLLGLLESKCGHMIGKPIDSLDFLMINAAINTLSPVISSGAYTDIDGTLNVYISQRTPLLRVYTNDNQDYYIDEKGVLFWSQTPNTAYTLIASGHISLGSKYHGKTARIDTLKNAGLLKNIFDLSVLIRKNKFLNALIDQVYITEDKEIELIPKVGRQVILFGGFKDMEEKLENLDNFYRQGIKEAGWRKYKTINLKFKDQIVCSKI
jgi:cell division protein FtsQ